MQFRPRSLAQRGHAFPAIIRHGCLLVVLMLLWLLCLSQTRWNIQAQSNPQPATKRSLPQRSWQARSIGAPIFRLEEAKTEAVPLMAGFTVDRLTDNNPGSGGEGAGMAGDLRYCLTQANALSGSDTISFSVTGTINLAGALPNISDHLTINGPGANLLTVRRNTGGDYRIFTINPGKVASISGLTITKGYISGSGGGGIFVGTGAGLNLSDSVVTDNEGHSFGGGILAFGALNINRCTVSFNQAGNGGGMYIVLTTAQISNSTVSNNTTHFQAGIGIQDSTVTIINSTVSGNSATVSASGIVSRAVYAAADTTVINSTVTNNDAPDGALWATDGGPGAKLSLKNTLVAANSPRNFDKYGAQGTLASLGHNLDSDGSSGFTNGVNGDIVGTIGSPINAQLGPLADNGGPTLTHALLPGSPAIDRGQGTAGVTTDQRGFARPVDIPAATTVADGTDIGAFEVQCAITLSPTTLPNGIVGTSYSQTLTVNGGTPPFNLSVTNGALPPGLSLNSATGVISGTPTVVGVFTFTITVAPDANGCQGSQTYTLTINCPTITLAPSLPAGTAGNSYSQTITVTPAGNYGFSIVQGSLPSGLTLNATTGLLNGLPTVTGSYTFTVKADAGNGCAGTQSYTLVINCPTVSLSPASLPNGTQGTGYSQMLSATPAGGNYIFNVSSGSLPPGLSLNSATGGLNGTPSSNGTFNFTITATGWGGCPGSQAYTITVGGGGCPAIALPASLPNGNVGQAYNQSVAATPAGSYTYAVTMGSLPPGVTLYNGAGLLYGYPTATGTFSFTITATDANSCMGSQAYTFTIAP